MSATGVATVFVFPSTIMLSIFITFLTFVLILVSLFMVLVILMQRANSNAGMGSAFGGGAAESAFGAETSNILTKATRYCAFAFFGISLLVYILYLRQTHIGVDDADLPVLGAPAAISGEARELELPAPAAEAPAPATEVPATEGTEETAE